MTRPSTPSNPASFIRLSSSSLGREISALCSLVLKVSGEAAGDPLGLPTAGICSAVETAPRLKPAAMPADVVMNSRRLIDSAMRFSGIFRVAPSAFYWKRPPAPEGSLGRLDGGAPVWV